MTLVHVSSEGTVDSSDCKCLSMQYFLVDICRTHKPYYVKNRSCLVYSDRNISSLLFLLILEFLFCFLKWSASTVYKHGCLRCFYDMNLSPFNKNLSIRFLSSCALRTKFHLIIVAYSNIFWFLISLKIHWLLVLW